MKKLISLLIILLPLLLFSQELILSNILIPGEEKISEQKAFLISENIQGPKKILLTAEYLRRHEERLSSSIRGFNQSEIDELKTLYSGMIYSPGIVKPFVFNNILPEELAQLDIVVFPNYLEQPYSLYLDLTVKYSSKPIGDKKSDDAGVYNGKLIIKIVELN